MSFAFVLSVCVAGCSQDGLVSDTKAVETEDLALGKAAQGDMSDWTQLWWEFNYTIDSPAPGGFVSCINYGAGEEAWFVGSGRAFAKQVFTPSGNVLQLIKYEMDDNVAIIGDETGDVWRIYRFNSHWTRHTGHNDGLTTVFQPDDSWYENEETGQRIKVLIFWRVTWEGDTVLSFEGNEVSCALMGPK